MNVHRQSPIKGLVFDIMKFAIHDGPGIRTTVFLKGCPLRCLWCHNPESVDRKLEISFIGSKCIGCGYCFRVCPQKCHIMTEKGHVYDREKCLKCGLCTAECYAAALEKIGKEMTVDEVIGEVLKDFPFYQTSGGGMTVSGGEPMAQFEFTSALLEEAKKNNLHVCMETSGFAPLEKYGDIMKNVDIFLFDIKESDPEKHIEYTGVPLASIMKTLEFLNHKGGAIHLRCPIIPGLNDREDHFKNIAGLANRYECVMKVEVEPYHPLGISKSERIGKEFPLKDMNTFPDKKITESWVESIVKHTTKPVTIN